MTSLSKRASSQLSVRVLSRVPAYSMNPAPGGVGTAALQVAQPRPARTQ
jgi:hypothetical protein